MTAQAARHQLDQAEGAALTLGRTARRGSGEIAQAGAARARRSPILTGALLLAVVTGGLLLVSARARATLRSSANGLGGSLRAARGPRTGAAKINRDAVDHQEALLDEGLEESFPASDPVSITRIT